MVRLRCTLFARIVRERRDRALSVAEDDFVRRHTLDCADCRATMHISDMCLDALSGARLEPELPEEYVPLRLEESRSGDLVALAPALVLTGSALLLVSLALVLRVI